MSVSPSVGSALSIGVDVGGTFTDLVAVGDDGRVYASKVPSTPQDQSEGVAAAIALLGGLAVARFVHGTTVATNMLLERTGARVALVATDGFTDLLHLARQDRASLYDLTRHHPLPLVPRELTVGVRERIEPEGVRLALDAGAVAEVVKRIGELAPDVVVVSLLHSYADDRHERILGDAIRSAHPALDVVLSCDTFPEIREYERTATTAAEGYLRPGVSRYLGRLRVRAESLGVPSPGVMTSGGGMRALADASHSAASLALSGPAGGVVGAAALLRAAGLEDALTVDIGGTSADVGLILGGEALVEPGGRVAGVPIALPRVLVETVSAGGGSIGWVDEGGALRVGPRSAGAVPGPAAFGRGGTLPTVTDAHVVLGHITATSLSGGVTLDASAAHAAVATLAATLHETPARVALAMIAIADASVARAMRRVSVERGVDPRDCVLVPFGGGGPLHCCGLAEQLGMRRIFVPPHAGALSALGLAITPERRERMASLLARADALDAGTLGAALEAVAARVRWTVREAMRAGDDELARDERWVVRARYVGQGHELDVPVHPGEDGVALAERFVSLHHSRNGFTLEAPVEVIGVRYASSGKAVTVRFGPDDADDAGAPRSAVTGPAVLALPGATLRIAPGWRATPHHTGGWLLDPA